MSACEQIQEELSAYLDGELSSQERATVDAHLKGCAACQAVLADLKEVQGALGDVPKLVPPATLASSIREQIRNGAPAAASGKVVTPPVPWGAKIFSGPAIVGLAALVMIGVLVFAVLPRLDRHAENNVAVANRTAAPAPVAAKGEREKSVREEALKDDEAPAGADRELKQEAAPHAGDAPAKPQAAAEEDRLERLAAKEADRGFSKPDEAGRALPAEEGAPAQQKQQPRTDRIGSQGGQGGGAGASGNAAAPQREYRKALEKKPDEDETFKNAPATGALAPKPQEPKAAAQPPQAPPATAAAPTPSTAPGGMPAQERQKEKAESNNLALRGADAKKAKEELAAQRKIEDAANRSGGELDLKKTDVTRELSKKEAEQLDTRRNLARDEKPAVAAGAPGKANQLQNGAAQTPQADDKAGKLAQEGVPTNDARMRAVNEKGAAAALPEGADKAPAAKAVEAAKGKSAEAERAAIVEGKKRAADDQHVESKRPTGPARAGEKKDGETAPAFTEVRDFGDALTVAPADIPESKRKMDAAAKTAADQKEKMAEAPADEPLVIHSDRVAAEKLLRELAQQFGAEIADADATKEQGAVMKDAQADRAEELAKSGNPGTFRLTIPAAQKDLFIAELQRRTASVGKDDRGSHERQFDGARAAEPNAAMNKLEEQKEQIQSNQVGQSPAKKAATVELVVVIEPPEAQAAPAVKARAHE